MLEGGWDWGGGAGITDKGAGETMAGPRRGEKSNTVSYSTKGNKGLFVVTGLWWEEGNVGEGGHKHPVPDKGETIGTLMQPRRLVLGWGEWEGTSEMVEEGWGGGGGGMDPTLSLRTRRVGRAYWMSTPGLDPALGWGHWLGQGMGRRKGPLPPEGARLDPALGSCGWFPPPPPCSLPADDDSCYTAPGDPANPLRFGLILLWVAAAKPDQVDADEDQADGQAEPSGASQEQEGLWDR